MKRVANWWFPTKPSEPDTTRLRAAQRVVHSGASARLHRLRAVIRLHERRARSQAGSSVAVTAPMAHEIAEAARAAREVSGPARTAQIDQILEILTSEWVSPELPGSLPADLWETAEHLALTAAWRVRADHSEKKRGPEAITLSQALLRAAAVCEDAQEINAAE